MTDSQKVPIVNNCGDSYSPLAVTDDIVGLVVIATGYTRHLTVPLLIIAIALVAVAAFAAYLRIRYGVLYLA